MSDDRKIILLRAARDILQKCHDSTTVEEVMYVTAIWDDAECDGFCLLEEITNLLQEQDS